MPSIEWNKDLWGQSYGWPESGEEWSALWGGAESQWFGAVFPRIRKFLPATRILEIAPGFGRWTVFLEAFCEELIGVDISDKCIAACRERFSNTPKMAFYVNDGKSLAVVEDESVGFVFSFDSLVHADADVLESYLEQLSHKLERDGIGFIHHSNLGAYLELLQVVDSTPETIREELFDRKFLCKRHFRSENVSADIFVAMCERAGLCCIGQELVNWGTGKDGLLNDCFSLITRKGSKWQRDLVRIENPNFMRERASLLQQSTVWTVQDSEQSALPQGGRADGLV